MRKMRQLCAMYRKTKRHGYQGEANGKPENVLDMILDADKCNRDKFAEAGRKVYTIEALTKLK